MEHLYLGRILRTDDLVISIECFLKPKNSPEDQKIKEFFMHFFDLYSNCQSIEYILKSLRIMLHSYEQDQIKVRWNGKKNGLMEISHNKLLKYEENEANIQISYQSNGKKEDLKFSNISIEDSAELKNIMEKTTIQVNDLKNYQPQKSFVLAYSQIYKIYCLFYGKKPNFQEENIEEQFQYMLAILVHFNICLNEVTFHQNSKKIPTSYYLKSMINALRPYMNVEDILENVPIHPKIAKEIQIIGQNICSQTDEINKIHYLKIISQVLYAKEWCLSSRASTMEIGKYLDMKPETVDEVLQLKKELKRKIEGE